ncbi:MAG: hypothetical protein Q8M29_08635 [Bacteroidota bacterium]|nr:hypothetical protein [Bacteroidota bacterium]
MILHAIIGMILTALIAGLTIYAMVHSTTEKTNPLKLISEITVLVLLPIYGFMLSFDECGEHPFNLKDKITPIVLFILPMFSYFISVGFKDKLPPLLNAILPIGLIIGIIYCIILTIHFFPFMHIGLIFPLLGLPLFAPAFSLMLLSSEFIRLHKYQQSQFLEQLKKSTSAQMSLITKFFGSSFWFKFPIFLLLCSPVIVIIQGILFLFGQRPDSLISMFTESCGFLLSNHHSCSCGGDHYLCSIAANGNTKLVKPVRLGLRQNEKILVNRQLLIANAFENWMEEKTPSLHKVIRKTYDSMGIQVNKWSKKRKIANIIYILMKPLEWFFLIWLYTFDKKPENRIALQYLSKKMYETFKNKHHGN